MTLPAPRQEIRKSRKLIRQRYYVRLVAGNNETLNNSEMFPEKQDAFNNARAVERIFGGPVGVLPIVDRT